MEKRFEYVLFDLDGTLTDPKEGICRSVQFALHQMGIEEPDIDRLEPFIGPPLDQSFTEFYQMSKEDAGKAVAHYRERFSAIGLYENEVYPGIPELLKNLKKEGVRLAVASSKPEVFVKRILDHFKLEEYFDVVVGSELDGRRSRKEEVVEEALRQLYGADETGFLKREESLELRRRTAMVGDRIFDMNGAKEYELHGVAAAYGYAPKGELEKSGADHISPNVKDLERYLLAREGSSNTARGKEIKRRIPGNSFFRALYMVAPFAVYYLAGYLVTLAGMKLVDSIPQGTMIGMEPLENYSAVIAGVIGLLAAACGGLVLFLVFRRTDPVPAKKQGMMAVVLTLLSGALLAMGLNLVISYIYMALEGDVALYEQATFNAKLPPGIAVLLYVFISPLAEELLFRWLLYGRISAVLGAPMAVGLTAVFFGFYHGNLLQGIYAACMGLALGLILCWSGQFWIPVIFHMAANAAVYFVSALPKKAHEAVIAPACSVLYMAAGIVILFMLYRNIKSRA